MPQLPREQVTQRHPRGVVSAHGVNLWESATDLPASVVVTEDEVDPLDVAMANLPHHEDQGSSAIDRSGFERDGAFGVDYFGDGYFGGDAE